MANCAYDACTSSLKYRNKPEMCGVRFIPFPQPNYDLIKCKKWIKACNRKDISVESVGKSTFICSKHFVGGDGPTERYPDPVTGTFTETEDSSDPKQVKLQIKRSPKITTLKQANSDNNTNKQVKFTVAHANTVDGPPTMPAGVVEELQVSTHVPVLLTPAIPALPTNVTRFPLLLSYNIAASSAPEQNSTSPLGPSPARFYSELFKLQIPKGWTPFCKQNVLSFFKMENETIAIAVTLASDLRLHVKVLGQKLPDCHPFRSCIPDQIVSTLEGIFSVLNSLQAWKVCSGTDITDYVDVISNHKTMKDCQLALYNNLVRSRSCRLLISTSDSNVCNNCVLMRNHLMDARKFGGKTCAVDLRQKLKLKSVQLACISRKLKRLKKKVEKKLEAKGQVLSDEDSEMDDLSDDLSDDGNYCEGISDTEDLSEEELSEQDNDNVNKDVNLATNDEDSSSISDSCPETTVVTIYYTGS